MGIMYKLLKHRKLNLDLKSPPNNADMKIERNRLITIEGNIIETTMPVTTADELTHSSDVHCDVDKQFTAEHIIQLCKFLAEKSRKSKSLYKQQQPAKKLPKAKQSQFAFPQTERNDNCDDVDVYQNEALPLLSKQRLEQKIADCDEFEPQRNTTVLSARLSPDINSLNISLNAITASSLQHHQQQQPQNIYNYQHQHQHQQQPQPPQTQGKRDILLKIRRQIIERKRLRENGAFEPQALNNSQVWRPW